MQNPDAIQDESETPEEQGQFPEEKTAEEIVVPGILDQVQKLVKSTLQLPEVKGVELIGYGQEGEIKGETPYGSYYGITSRGVGYKDKNEDGVGIIHVVSPEDKLTLEVVDGIGGYVSGEQASGIVLEETLILGHKSALPFEEALKEARDRMRNIPLKRDQYTGSTCLALEIKKDNADIYNIGDSALYILRKNGQFLHLNPGKNVPEDQLLEDLSDAKKMEKIMEKYNDKEYISRRRLLPVGDAITLGSDLNIRHISITPEKGDIFIMATDGLETLSPEEIREILSQIPEKAEPQRIAQTLYNEAINRMTRRAGGEKGLPIWTKCDNISIIVYVSDEPK